MKRLIVALSLLSPFAMGHSAFAERARPNILFILTDDQGWPTLGCYGGKRVPTPHLDALAKDGMRFTDAYVTPQCTPTRAALLTGQSTARNRMWHVIGRHYHYPWGRVQEPVYADALPRATFTVAKGLRAAGYATGIIGKWHLSTDDDGSYTGLKPEAAPHYGFEVSIPTQRNEQATGDKGVNRFTDEAIRFITERRERPWFLYLAHHTIHGPVVAPEDLVAKYRAQGAPETGVHNATYLAAIEHLDSAVGRLLAALDALELRERTLVVFLSDNGGVHQQYQAAPFLDQGKASQTTPTQLDVEAEQFSNAPLRAGKGSPYEGGIRVPCIVRWRGGELQPRPLFWYLPLYEVRFGATPGAIIREGDWKLIEFFGDWFDPQDRYVPGARLELYHLRTDLGETTNLAENEPARAATLRTHLHAWLQSIPAEIPGPNPAFDERRQLLETTQDGATKQPTTRQSAIPKTNP